MLYLQCLQAFSLLYPFHTLIPRPCQVKEMLYLYISIWFVLSYLLAKNRTQFSNKSPSKIISSSFFNSFQVRFKRPKDIFLKWILAQENVSPNFTNEIRQCQCNIIIIYNTTCSRKMSIINSLHVKNPLQLLILKNLSKKNSTFSEIA